MGIQTVHFKHHHHLRNPAESRAVPVMVDSFRETLALLGAVSAAIAIVMFSVWVIGTPMQAIYSAMTWGAGLIFLAMAVDSSVSTAFLKAVTGLGLLFLAWLQGSVSADFTVVTGMLIALWVAASLFRRLR
jgi:fatty acid desaturase